VGVTERDSSFDIAVTGIAARFPGPTALPSWWEAVTRGQVLTSRLEHDEVLARGIPEYRARNDWVPVVAELSDAYRFDNAFFGMSPREAELTDPQHRLALEVAWQALEDAGVPPRHDDRATAVFSSMTGSAYLRAFLASAELDPTLTDDLIHGCEPEFMASRIAYKLGLRGPAMAVQTACSSSLVGIHLAVQALLGGDCDQALVVGTGLTYPDAGHQYQPGGILSASGACRPFSAAADGVVGGSGAAAVVLRRAGDMVDADAPPHALILGTAVNNDGPEKVGYYAPSPEGQRRVIRAALSSADVPGSTVGFLQTHGTATALGDPIEWAAASAAYAECGATPGQIAIGAIKANIGHLDACAGLAGLISTVLVLESGEIPPVAGFDAPNPQLDVAGSPLRVPRVPEVWTGPEPRRAGVSSFGIGGTNAHVVLERFASDRASSTDDGTVVLPLSARDGDALRRSAEALCRTFLEPNPPALPDVAHTLAWGREEFPCRAAVTARGPVEAAARLRDLGADFTTGASPRPLLLVYPGQGTQSPGMAVPYIQALPGLRERLEYLVEATAGFGSWTPSELLAALVDETSDPDALIQTSMAQPAIACLQLAITDSLRGLGMAPTGVIGHSLGEIAAACAAGAFTAEDAARFASRRGAAMQDCPTGSMLAVGCSADDALGYARKFHLELAAVNSPTSCVLSGRAADVRSLAADLPAAVHHRVLPTNRAFHSRLIEPSVAAIAAAGRDLEDRPLTTPLVTTGEARLVEPGGRIGATYWAGAARTPVRFADAIAAAVARYPDTVVLEIGPGCVLSPALEEMRLDTASTGVPARGTSRDVLEGLGRLWTLGVGTHLRQLSLDGRAVHLPPYPFRGPEHLPPELSTAGSYTVVEEPGVPVVLDADIALRTAWSSTLGDIAIRSDADFFDLGGDSLLAVRLTRAVNAATGLQVPVRDLMLAREFGAQLDVIREIIARQ
jgi:phthiocerol/phenolphthiocerol synthesis type-I polyketide synthase E